MRSAEATCKGELDEVEAWSLKLWVKFYAISRSHGAAYVVWLDVQHTWNKIPVFLGQIYYWLNEYGNPN